MIFLFLACGPKEPVKIEPKVGWHQDEGWSLACYYPPDFDKLDELSRREARETAMDSILGQWSGNRADGVSFDSGTVEDIETILLSQPEKVEELSKQNLATCSQVAAAVSTMNSWNSWVDGLPSSLTAGECNNNFVDTVFDYLNITVDYENSFPICEGDIIVISGTIKDQYRIVDDGEWITVEGDLNSKSLGKENLPCNIENCYDGMLIMKFTSSGGTETIYPVGSRLEFKAPSHGRITYGINDDTFYDNVWYQSGGLIDHASVEISPAK